ncbi:MAG: hypothetical protein ACOH5I_05450 [Oligoflexus sp.]
MNQYANTSSVSTLRSLSPWQASWQSFRTNWRPVLVLGLFGIMVPILVLDITQSLHSAEHADQVRALVSITAPPAADHFIEAALSYLGQFFISWLICGSLVAVTFFALLYQARSLHVDGRSPSLARCLKEGLSQFLRRGIFAFILSFIFMALVANLVLSLFGASGIGEVLLLIFAALHLIVPVLLVQTHANPLRIVLSAITLGYVPRLRGVKWSVFFQLITWEFLILLSLTLISMVRHGLLNLDLWLPIPRETWLHVFGQLPFGFVYLITSFTSALIFAGLLCGLAMLMTVYYLNLVIIYNQLEKVRRYEANQDL